MRERCCKISDKSPSRWIIRGATRFIAAVTVAWMTIHHMAAQAQDVAPDDSTLQQGVPQGFDSNSVFDQLDQATANEATATGPFMGLASPIYVDPLFGTANTTIHVDTPPGRNGMTPEIDVHYSSNSHNGPFGFGWNLLLGSITRNTAHGVPFDYTKSPPVYGDATGSSVNESFVLAFRGKTILLDVPLPAGGGCSAPWAPTLQEIWMQACFDPNKDQWTVEIDQQPGHSKASVTYIFGGSREARTGNNVDAVTGTFGWYLTQVVDISQNRIGVTYDSTALVGTQNAAAYPLHIDYGGNGAAGYQDIFHVMFEYLQRRADVGQNYRGGFAGQISRLVSGVDVWTDGTTNASCGAASSTCPNRKYTFGYQPDPDTGVSLLSSVGISAFDGTSPPPATTFQYTSKAHSFDNPVPLMFDHPPSTQAAAGVQVPAASSAVSGVQSGFIDVNGDHLPDFLDGFATDASGNHGLDLYINRGNGQFEWQGQSGLWTTSTSYLSANYSALDSKYGYFTRLLDIDGDGLPDLVSSGDCPGSNESTCNWFVWMNRGGTLDAGRTLWPGVPTDLQARFPSPSPPQGSSLPAAQLVDLNGDGLPDLLDCSGWDRITNQFCRFYQSTGSSFASGIRWLVPRTPNCDVSTNGINDTPLALVGWGVVDEAVEDASVPVTGKKIIDINGDGLPDLVTSCSDLLLGWELDLNTGSGFGYRQYASPVESFKPYVVVEPRVVLDQNNAPKPYTFCGCDAVVCPPCPTAAVGFVADINGDGLIDFFEYADGAGHPVSTLTPNLGRGHSTWAGGAGSQYPVLHKADGSLILGLLDINGDGLIDQLRVLPSPTWQTSDGVTGYYTFVEARPNTPPRGNLLSGMDNGLGMSWQISYRASAETAALMPFPVWTVSRVAVSSASTYPVQSSYETKYEFWNGQFDTADRAFRGFGQSLELRTADRRMTYRQYAAPGSASGSSHGPLKLEKQQLVDRGQQLAETDTSWGLADVGDGRRVWVQRTQQTQFTGAKWHKRTFDSYDTYNNVTGYTDSGDDVGPVTTTLTYDPSCVKQPTTVSVTDATQNLVVSLKQFRYDSQCRLTQVSESLAQSGQSAATGALIVTGQYLYDPNIDPAAQAGLPTTIIETRRKSNLRATRSGRKRMVTIRYDSNGLFPRSVTNPLNQMTTRGYDLRFGKLASVVDPNGNNTTFTYDGFGRLKSVARVPDSLDWRWFEYGIGNATSPSRIVTHFREPNNATQYRTVVDFFDGLGRPLETKAENIVNGSAEVTVGGALTYDFVGRIQQRFVPFASANDINTYDPPAVAATSLAYDSLDRIKRVINPDGSWRDAIFDPPGTIETRDENYTVCAAGSSAPANASCPGRREVDTFDSFGRLVSAQVYEGAASLISKTVNQYDVLGHVLSTTTLDGAGNSGSSAVTFAYDSLGRRTSMAEKDSGTWTYGYDEADNLIYQDDPKLNQHLEFCYDILDRLTRIAGFTAADAPSGSPCTGGTTLASCTYDTAPGGIGHLAQAKALANGTAVAVTEVGSYDPRGRPNPVTETVTVPGHSAVSFQSQRGYDFADRLTGIGYPTDVDGAPESINYGYNSVGQLVSATGVDTLGGGKRSYVQSAQYDRFGRLSQTVYGPSLLTNTWTYSPQATDNFRLNRILVQSGSATLQDFRYGPYDPVGNLQNAADAPGDAYAASSSLGNNWTYTYDGLGRLHSAQWGSVPAAANFSYDFLGNMSAGNLAFPNIGLNTAMTFANDPLRPHHLTTMVLGSGAGVLADREDIDRGDGDIDMAQAAAPSAAGLLDVSSAPTKTGRRWGSGSRSLLLLLCCAGLLLALAASAATFTSLGLAQTVSYRQVAALGGLLIALGVAAFLWSNGIALGPTPAHAGGGGGALPSTYESGGANGDGNGGLVTRPATVSGDAGKGRISYDIQGRVRLVTLPDGTTTTQSVYDDAGTRVARIVNGTDVTVFFGNLFEVHGSTLTRHIQFGGRRVAFSPVTTPPSLTVASAASDQSTTMLAQLSSPGQVKAKAMAFLRGLLGVRSAWAGGGGGGGVAPSVRQVYFVHSDRLGSTTMLTAYNVTGYTNGAVIEYYRYGPYGKMQAYQGPLTNGVHATVAAGSEKTDLLYTGKRWDSNAQLYDLGARFYDPYIARFVTEDPLGAYMNPYAYTRWNPTNRIDLWGLDDQDVCEEEGTCDDPCADGGCSIDTGNISTPDTSTDMSTATGTFTFSEQLTNSSDWSSYMGEARTDWGTTFYVGAALSAWAAPAAVGVAGTALVGSGAKTAIVGTAESVVQEAVSSEAGGIVNLLRPGGELIGEAGSSARTRILQGGVEHAEALFQQLRQGGSVLENARYPGTLVDLPGVGQVGLRPVSTSGPPTIDVFVQGLGIRKIKFLP